ncbi:MAG: hypothetical protein ACKV2V_21645 [Blastocatellia bacterium]
MKNPLTRHRKRRREAVAVEATRLTGKLTLPAGMLPTITPPAMPPDDGVIRPDTGKLHLPADVYEPGADVSDERADLVMLVIVLLSLLFIGLVTLLIVMQPAGK